MCSASKFFSAYIVFQEAFVLLFICLSKMHLFWAALGCCMGFLQLRQVRAPLWFLCLSFSLPWLLLSPSTASKCMGFSSCGTWAPGGMWNLPRPGIEPMSPALAGRFLTTEPLGKSQDASILKDDTSISKSNKFDKLWQKQSSTSYLAELLLKAFAKWKISKNSQVF